MPSTRDRRGLTMATVRLTKGKKNFRVAQAATDAQLEFKFEQQAKEGTPGSWDYLNSVVEQTRLVYKEGDSGEPVDVPAYLQHVQRPGFIQPFGTLVILQEKTLQVLAVAENAWEFLDKDTDQESPSDILGRRFDTLFTPESSEQIEQSLQYSDLSLANPLLVRTAKTGRPYYAILHRIDVGIVVDLEPLKEDEALGGDWKVLDKHDRASASIAKLQGCNDMTDLCNTLVQEVKALTGYDRIMLYKFHEDQHGEVIAEAKEDSLTPLLGLHFPANDVPQANRQLFVDVRLRMIADTQAGNVNIILDPSLEASVPLSKSTLRGVAGCHKEYSKNLGCMATLVMAVVLTVDPHRARHLWGLVCCHHHSGPRVIPYPQRGACGFLIQAFALQLGMEMEAAEEAREKRVLHMQAVLCGMLTRDAPLGLIRQSPNIQDLVPADGAVLLHAGKAWMLGCTPTEAQISELAKWLAETEGDLLSQGVFVTNSLEAAGYPEAASLAPAVCGLAAASVSDFGDFLMWFRSGMSKQIKWAGHKDTHAVKEGANMHPRMSFDAYLEVAKLQSPPWQDAEVDAMQGLKLIVRDSLPEKGPQELRLKIQAQLNAERLRIQNQVTQVARSLQVELESARVPIIGLWGSGVVSEWNAKVAELTKRPKNEVMGLSFPMDLLAEEFSRETFRKAMEVVAGGEEMKPIDLCLAARSIVDGPLDREIHIVASLYAHHDTHGNLIGVRMVGQDITALKVLSGEYKVAPEEARATLDASDMLVFAIDEAGRVSEWNVAMERISGLSREQVMNKRLVGDVLSSSPVLIIPNPQDSLVHFEIALCQALNGMDTRNHEFHFNTWDGKQMDTLMHIISRKGSEGETIGATCFMQDMMERRAAENASAVRMVAEAASQAKTMQLAFLCHEIRNPLNGILSSISFMQDTDMTPEQRDMVVTTASCGNYLRRVVDDVLDLSKIEEGKLEIDGESFSLMQVVDAVVSQEAPNAYEKGLKLYCTTDPACVDVSVKGDRLRVQQIVANFARNAVEYTSSGWVEIKLKAEKADAAGSFRFVFSVSDTGKGMSPTQLATVFSMPEELASPSDATKTFRDSLGGAGLGLVVCQKLASLMGGTVHCLTHEGSGSTFKLCLELRSAKEPEDMAEDEDQEQSLKNRLKGVIYTTVGEWSSAEELSNAEFPSPTVAIPQSSMADDAPPTHGADGDCAIDESKTWQAGKGMESQPFMEDGELEQVFGGHFTVQVMREVIDWAEVAVLVEVDVLDPYSGELGTSIQEWGSARRVGSLGQELRAATHNAVITAARSISALQYDNQWLPWAT